MTDEKKAVGIGYRQARYQEPLLFEMEASAKGRLIPDCPIEPDIVPKNLARTSLDLPELNEVDVIRHYTRLAEMNYGVDNGIYPLGSCTMKYNPKVCETVAGMPGFAEIHPYQNEETVQGILKCLYELQEALKEVSGMAGVSLQPMAGAHGEFTGILVIEAYHRARNNRERDEILVPDTAHGTNPASAAMVGYKVIEIPSKDGCVDLDALKAAVGEKTAGLMLTNPNTLGIFEKDICEVAKIVHDAGGLVYYDGANLNAIIGICRPGDMGFDVLHFNLHKTFATPHGGGGPGSGPIGVREDLVPFLPVPVVSVEDGVYYLDYDLEHTIGKVSGHFGNIGVCIKAWAYVKLLGGKGLRDVGEMSVLNSNYMKDLLKGTFGFPHRDLRKHEFVLSAKCPTCEGIKALNIAKRLLDYGVHPPTIYFPLIVEEAMMFEPTETEPKKELDRVVEAMLAIAKEDKQIVLSAPHSVKVSKVDETLAAKDPILSYKGLKAHK